MEITGAELFVKALKEESVTTLFAYPGGQAIDLFNALYGEKDIDVILPRHEQGLVHAANGAISNCDVLISIGTRFNDGITGKIEEFATDAKIIHIDIDAASISRNIVVDVPIVADAKKAICTLLEKAEPLSILEWVNAINHWK